MSTSTDRAASISLTEAAYQALKERLVLLDIAPGAPINEQGLSAELAIGRTPLREALKRLESDHLVVSFPRRGTFASPVDMTALSEISEIRRALEPLAARIAAQRSAEVDRYEMERLRGVLATMPDDTSPRDTMEHDLQVHRAIYRATHNLHLQAALVRYGSLATRIWSVAAPRLSNVESHVVELVDLLHAIEQGDGHRAEELMLEHMADFEARIRTVL
ncbi:GntR family transcriptional regulator [Allobranchiibius sp. CTAmp26]|uniref:GntR family transcriptional regulator n=1 Tax=Allobranchiibius sp. CTAmp26 TaxID=2815214 RepID=UPI001AA125D7|nr:GntR family transcriptional regulator [Allobranchiibius sp. CTAmp26]MBO1754559.1 GntR family transcriptional regulator [Allobranchiibius sp. CTAmp26]